MNPFGRPKVPPRKQLSIYLPEELYHKMILLCPELLTPAGVTRYGAVSTYFSALVSQDLARREESLRNKLTLP
jgi:hypothetical protein